MPPTGELRPVLGSHTVARAQILKDLYADRRPEQSLHGRAALRVGEDDPAEKQFAIWERLVVM